MLILSKHLAEYLERTKNLKLVVPSYQLLDDVVFFEFVKKSSMNLRGHPSLREQQFVDLVSFHPIH